MSAPSGRTVVDMVEAQRRALQRGKWRQTVLFTVVMVVLIVISGQLGEVSWQKFVNGIPRFGSYIWRIIPTISIETLWVDLLQWMWGFERWVALLFDTLLIAFVATTLGVVAGFLLSFPAAHNLTDSIVGYQITRRFLELMRTVPELVFAMLFVFAFGLGAMAGVLAIALHTTGVLGKLFSEVNETVTGKSLEGVLAAGAARDQVIRLGVVPQVMPAFISYSLLRFEINVRSASVIGFVGAGGIGQELMFVINQFIYRDISAILVLLITTVALVDIVSEKIRHRILDGEHKP